MKLELVIVPVADVDLAKAFYSERVGFTVDVDHSAGEDFRIVQLTQRPGRHRLAAAGGAEPRTGEPRL